MIRFGTVKDQSKLPCFMDHSTHTEMLALQELEAGDHNGLTGKLGMGGVICSDQ